jgi:hypothetical protein
VCEREIVFRSMNEGECEEWKCVRVCEKCERVGGRRREQTLRERTETLKYRTRQSTE